MPCMRLVIGLGMRASYPPAKASQTRESRRLGAHGAGLPAAATTRNSARLSLAAPSTITPAAASCSRQSTISVVRRSPGAMIGMPGGSFGSEMVVWTSPARVPSRRHAGQLGALGAAGGRGWPRRFCREHLDGAGDAFLGGGSALSVRAVAALEQSLDEHELL